jgi:cytochrome c biogenesis protein CcdA
MGIGSLALAFVAGVLSILSPCVLPIVPLVLGAAASAQRFGPVALAGGLAISFTVLGLFVATIGFAAGISADVFRYGAAAIMAALGIVLVVPRFQAKLAAASGPIANWTDRRFGASKGGSLGQFGVGLLLGAVWSPCVGPTLGAASLLASRGENLPQVATIMLAFGLGAALPLLLLGTLSRDALVRWRSRIMTAGTTAKAGLGALLLLVGLFVLTGIDKRLETVLVSISPQSVTDLTTRY